MNKPLTDSQYRALTILARVEQITSHDFAHKMWPGKWIKPHGYELYLDIMMSMAGDECLSHLSQLGLVHWWEFGGTWAISQAGREALERERDNEEK